MNMFPSGFPRVGLPEHPDQDLLRIILSVDAVLLVAGDLPRTRGTADDDFLTALRGAVHAYVSSHKAEGLPPERVLVNIKAVTSPRLPHAIETSVGAYINDFILRAFLRAYYGETANDRARERLPPPR